MDETGKKWKFYIGVGFFGLYIINTIAFFVVPLLGFSGTQKIAFMTIIGVFGEISFLLSLLLLGKAVIRKAKEKFWQWFRRPIAAAPVYISKRRHKIGVWLFFISFLPYPLVEVSLLFGYPAAGEHTAYLFILLAGDILFVISLFVLGEPFWEKITRLFKWDGQIREGIPT